MRLYVHYEDAALKWTKRVTVEPRTATLQYVLARFGELFRAKFTRDLDLKRVAVFTERHQNESTRRRIERDKLDKTLQQLGLCLSVDDEELTSDGLGACEIELIVTTGSPTEPGTTDTSKKLDAHTRPPATTSRVASRDARSASQAVDAGLRATLDAALGHLKARRHRAARETYETLVLRIEPLHPEALLGLGEIYFSIGKFDVAADKYFRPCWRAHHTQPASKAYALMAFTSALKLAECELQLKQYRTALATLDDLQRFLRRHAKCRSFFGDTIDKERMEAQMDFLRALALYELQTPAEQDTAIALLMHLLPDLQDPHVNLDALQLYARVAQDRGRKNEALSMLLRVLVGKSTDPSVRRQLVGLLRGKNGMERLLCSVPTTTPSAAAAYAFTATILKDFGAVASAVRCFEHALALTPTSAAYALNLCHALEVCHRDQAAYESLLTFLRANRSLHVLGTVTAVDVLAAVGSDAWRIRREDAKCSLTRWSMTWEEDNGEGFAVVHIDGSPYKHRAPKPPTSKDLAESELDLLACFFTLVKILFINGRLHALPSLIALLEPLRRGRQLHKTSIRNEQAYYMCIAQLLCITPMLAVPVSDSSVGSDPADASPEPVMPTFICGDSHTLATAWRTIYPNGSPVQLRPALVTGLKHWHLRKESEFYPKINFWRVLEALPRRARVVFLLGEIDCREGLLQAVELCKYEVRAMEQDGKNPAARTKGLTIVWL
jgi:tetratricopeptide (TPR) repeat protein